jgi:hypothetical protein
MSSHPFPRPVACALVLAALLCLTAPPAQAAERSTLLDHLGAKVQTWLAGWLPGIRIDAVGTRVPEGVDRSQAAPAPGRSGGSLSSHQIHRGVKPLCDTGGTADPNGCPPH